MTHYITKYLSQIIPSRMTIIQYITFLIEIVILFSWITNSSIHFPYLTVIERVCENLFFDSFVAQLSFFVFLLNTALIILQKFSCHPFYFYCLVSHVNEWFFLYLSSFLLYAKTFNSSFPNNFYDFVYLLIIIVHFLFMFLTMVDEQEFEDKQSYNSKKLTYMNYTLKKYENKSIDEIEKRIALLELYKTTDELYNQLIYVDDEFRKEREYQ